MTVESPEVLFSSDGQQWRKPDRPLRWESADNQRVTKIVIGKLAGPGEEAEPVTLKTSLPEDLAERFPHLSHLHLWHVDNLTSLPRLPDSLRVLDIRACPNLVALPKLPAQLESLVLTDCPTAVLPLDQPAKFPALSELILSGSTSVSADWIERTLVGSQGIRRLDLSRCGQVKHIKSYPSQLVDLRLENCESLRSLFNPWPRGLRRVSLRGASALAGIPSHWPASLDYVDLAHTRSLAELPRPKQWPRTLFLFGSRVHVPPASEHGATADENVAERTAKFFADVDLTGGGDVKRCKLLILGNGGAGKTCLSAALTPDGDPQAAKKLGSTHGVQFWEWDFPAPVQKGVTESVQLTLWDFGGQEIYHNTHRLFMSKGAVFLVVWNPAQDDQQPNPNANGYQDEWRPLQYWLDFIRQACPHAPRIAIVCSHHEGSSPQLENRLRDKLQQADFDSIPRFYVDSLSETRERDGGGLSKLRDWLETSVGSVVQTQGTAVPAYWEVAQDLVAGWVRRMKDDATFAAAHNYLTPEQFRQHLNDAIGSRLANDADRRFEQLADAVRSGRFVLDEDRLRRTLEFLTHSGWAYWDPRLFAGQVIIGQQWALDGLYAVLERRDDSTVFQSLTHSGGRFTLEELGQWRWNAFYGADEQKLLLSFMERCGLCFQLRRGYDAWREQDVYVSFEHLPKLGRDAWVRQFETRLKKTKTETWDRTVPGLHKYHWQRFLYEEGAHYGKDAQYGLDGFYLENDEREKLLVLYELDPSGLGGRIEVRVGGKNADERLKSAVEYVERFLPDREASQPVSPESGMGKREGKQEVFISYAWDPPENGSAGGIPPGYEEPVNAIEQFLKDKPVIVPYRDKTSMNWGASIKAFMQHGASRLHVIVVHSDKSWKSPFCCYELLMVKDELLEQKDRDWLSVVIPVGHPTSRIENRGAVDVYIEHWKQFNERDLPASIKEDAHHFVTAAAPGVIDWFHRKSDLNDDNLTWPVGDNSNPAIAARQAEVLAKIAARLGLEPARRENHESRE